MIVNLSASSIKDFISCTQKYYYRRYHRDLAVPSTALSIGSIVHDVIENAWENHENATKHAENLILGYTLSEENIKTIYKYIDNFFFYFRDILTTQDEIEVSFKIPYLETKDMKVNFLGKFDRVIPGGVLIDWKTGSPPRGAISSDPQFLIYNWAFEKVYGSRPSSILFAALKNGKHYRFVSSRTNESLLFDRIIPEMLTQIRNENFIPDGRLQYQPPCYACSFHEACVKDLRTEIDNELVSRKLIVPTRRD